MLFNSFIHLQLTKQTIQKSTQSAV